VQYSRSWRDHEYPAAKKEGPPRVIAGLRLISLLSLRCQATDGSNRPPASISTHINKEHDNEGGQKY
jgi:hypothetical protein